MPMRPRSCVSRCPSRGLRLATLIVDTAGAQPMRGIRMIDLDQDEADAGADRLHAAFLAARATRAARKPRARRKSRAPRKPRAGHG